MEGKIKWLWLFFGLWPILQLNASAPINLRFQRIGNLQGLPHSIVLNIYRDSKGFMWLSTGGGLAKYDGYSFQLFSPSPFDKESLSSLSAGKLTEDTVNGKPVMWIAGINGLSRLDLETEKFLNHALPGNFNIGSVNCVLNSGPFLWVGGSNGLFKLDTRTNNVIQYISDSNIPHSLPSNFISTIVANNRYNELWIGTKNNFCRLNLTTNTFERYQFEDYRHFISSIYCDAQHNLWVGYPGGLAKFNRSSNSFTITPWPISIRQDNLEFIKQIIGGPEHSLFIVTGKGIWHYDVQKKRFKVYCHSENDPHSLSIDQTTSAYYDPSGLLWVGTLRGGLNVADLKQKAFKTIYGKPFVSNSPPDNIQSVLQDKNGYIWMGTADKGISLYNPKDNTWRYITSIPGNSHSLTTNFIASLFIDSHNTLWVGSGMWGLMSLDLNKHPHIYQLTGDISPRVHFTRYLPSKKNGSIAGWSQRCTLEDNKGYLWFGTVDGGIAKYDVKTGLFKNYLAQNDSILDKKAIQDWTIYHTSKDWPDIIWIGTLDKGLVKFNTVSEVSEFYQYNPNDSNSISDNGVRCIYQDADGVFWIGTGAGGLNKMIISKTGQPLFKHYTTRNGLPNNAVYGILPDEKGRLWLSTEFGLSVFDKKTERFKNFDRSDGLSDNEFSYGAYYKNPQTGEMFFGGLNGVTSFFPEAIYDNSLPPTIVFTGVRLFNQPVKPGETYNGRVIMPRSTTYSDTLIFKHSENVITIEFAALEYIKSHRCRYKYILEGFNENWVDIKTENRVSFTNLNPGFYTLHVKAANSDGYWNPTEALIYIVIEPPFWRTWWFKLLLTGFLGLVLWWYFKRRTWRLQHQKLVLQKQVRERTAELENANNDILQKNEELKTANEMKSRFLANISHDFRTPLSLIIGPAEELIRNSSENSSELYLLNCIHKNGKRLFNLISQLLDLSRLEAGVLTLRVSEANLSDCIAELAHSFTYLSEKFEIQYNIQIPNESLIGFFDREKMERIVYNLLSNAFKYTEVKYREYPDKAGKITISLSSETLDGQFCAILKVSDNGIGIKPELETKIFDRFFREHTAFTRKTDGIGIGLSLVARLVELHKGSIGVESTLNKGSEFWVKLPLSQMCYTDSEISSDLSSAEPIYQSCNGNKEVIGLANHSFEMETPPSEFPLLLLVDDNAELLDYVAQNLRNTYRILTASDGIEGLQLAKKHQPDVLISDVAMPRMDGFELCRQLRSDASTSHIPVILLTARSTTSDQIEGFETGADDYITKPFNMQLMQLRIKKLIETRNKLRERFSTDLHLQPSDISVNSADERFLTRLMQLMEENMANSDFGSEELQQAIGISRTQLYTKIKALTGLSINIFIRTVRLKRAAQLLQSGMDSVAEVAFNVGFSDQNYFTKCFSEQFDMSPKKYYQTHSKKKNSGE